MNTPTQTTATSIRNITPADLPLMERIKQVSRAWSNYAPESKFASLTLAQFNAATEPSERIRTTMEIVRLSIRGGIATRAQADKASTELLNRVIAGTKADAAFGPNSALYRAMGFVTTQERKTPGRRTPSAAMSSGAVPAKAPRAPQLSLMKRLEQVLSAWSEVAPKSPLAGMSLGEFQAGIAASKAARDQLFAAKSNYAAGIATRGAADMASRELVNRVISSAKGELGDNCPLYRALGYIPSSEKRSARRQSSGDPRSQVALGNAPAREVELRQPLRSQVQLGNEVSNDGHSATRSAGKLEGVEVEEVGGGALEHQEQVLGAGGVLQGAGDLLVGTPAAGGGNLAAP